MSQQSSTSKYLITWRSCANGENCSLNNVDLTHIAFDPSGCYVIWHGGSEPKVVYVGQGQLRERLTSHRSNTYIQAYAALGLYVTWATVNEPARDGVEAYLADRFQPLVGDRHPDVPHIVVNGPWD